MPASLSPRDLLLAELAVQTGFAGRQQVDDCIAELKKGGMQKSLAQALFARGHIDQTRMKLLEQLADKDPPAPAPVSTEDDGAELSKLVELKRHAAAGDVDKVMAVLKEMKSDGKFGRLGKILLKKSMLNAEQIHALLDEKGIKILRCPACRKTYEVKEFDPARKYGCGRCKEKLKPVDFSEIPIPDSDMEVVVEEG